MALPQGSSSASSYLRARGLLVIRGSVLPRAPRPGQPAATTHLTLVVLIPRVLGMNEELAKGHLDLLLLGALETGPAHGYAIIRRLRDLSDSFFDLPEGSVYPALHRLEREGLLKSSWEQGSRPRRRYALTRRGKAELARQRHGWKAFSRAVNSVAQPAL